MRRYVKTDVSKRITATTDEEFLQAEQPLYDFPDGFDFDMQQYYKFEGGELTFDEEYFNECEEKRLASEAAANAPTPEAERIAELEEALELLLSGATQ